MKHYLSFLLFVTILAGCAPNTTRELQAEAKPHVFTVNQNYEEVYENLVFQLEGCTTQSAFAMHMFVQNRLNKKQRIVEMVLRSTNMGDVGIWLQAKVHYQGPSRTKVEIWETNAGNWGNTKYVMEKWAVSGYQECR